MPLPPMLIFTLVSGVAAALAARNELRTSPRPVALTRSFFAYVSYAVLVVVPITVYFYVFHGDWFLLYFADVSQIPSAIALVGFVLQAGLGALAFLFGAVLVRSQREMIAGIVLGVFVVGGAGGLVMFRDRLAKVGSYAEYRGQFGLTAYEDGPVLTGTLALSALAIFGLSFLLVRLWQSGRR